MNRTATERKIEPTETLPLMNEDGAAAFLGGVSHKHLFNLRAKAGLPFVRVGSRIMYQPESLRRWIAEREECSQG